LAFFPIRTYQCRTDVLAPIPQASRLRFITKLHEVSPSFLNISSLLKLLSISGLNPPIDTLYPPIDSISWSIGILSLYLHQKKKQNNKLLNSLNDENFELFELKRK
jgi:hypothetical protein